MQSQKIYLIRHGESSDGMLTSVGEVQAIYAAERFLKDWNKKSVIAYHSPVLRAKSSATLFTRRTGILTFEDALLHINTFHDHNAQWVFALKLMNCLAGNIVLIGHDETRSHLAPLTTRLFGYRALTKVIPLGGVLALDESNNITLLS